MWFATRINWWLTACTAPRTLYRFRPEGEQRLRAALSVATRHPVRIDRQPASTWLRDALATRRDGELTVVWHSIMRQYVEPEEWTAMIDYLAPSAN